MEIQDCVMGIISAPVKDGKRLARDIIDSSLAACVQISAPVISIYRWEGSIEEEQEVLLFLKTRREKITSIREFLDREHPYDVPEFIILPITDGHPAYLEWVNGTLPR